MVNVKYLDIPNVVSSKAIISYLLFFCMFSLAFKKRFCYFSLSVFFIYGPLYAPYFTPFLR